MLNLDLPPHVVEAFDGLASAQRGKPERAMEEAQFALGGGVMSFVVEHAGDLSHRGWAKYHLDTAGFGYVKDKVDKVLHHLRNPYGFIKEHYENMTSNARYLNRDRHEYIRQANSKLEAYAQAHSQLPVYNCAQWRAREAAIQLGKINIRTAVNHLEWLEDALATPGKWKRNALIYHLDKHGNIESIC